MMDEDSRPTYSASVPTWLAVVVLGLLLAVVAAAGFILRGYFELGATAGSAMSQIARKEAQVAREPEDVESLLALGSAYHEAGRLREAVVQFDTVLEIRPFDTAALYGKGLVLMEQGSDKQAEEILWDVLERDPGHVLAAKRLGEFYADRSEYRSLIYTIRPVVEESETSADLQYLMGYGYENLGRGDLAEERYRLALRYWPDMTEAKEGLERLGVVE